MMKNITIKITEREHRIKEDYYITRPRVIVREKKTTSFDINQFLNYY